jgi:hypothetical protein
LKLVYLPSKGLSWEGILGERDNIVGTGVSSANHARHQNEKPLSVSANHALPVGTDTPSKLAPKIPTHESLERGGGIWKKRLVSAQGFWYDEAGGDKLTLLRWSNV